MKTAWHKRVTNLPPSNVTVWETRADPKHCCICGVRLPTDAQHELRPTAVNHHCRPEDRRALFRGRCARTPDPANQDPLKIIFDNSAIPASE